MSETCITSSSAAARGSDVLGARGRGRDDRVIARSERDDQRGERLGQRMGVDRVVGDPHLGDAGELRGRLGRRADVVAGDEDVDRLPDLERRGQRPRGHVAQVRRPRLRPEEGSP